MSDAITLHHPPGSVVSPDGHGGWAVTVPGRGPVFLDIRLGTLWQLADGLTLAELAATAVTPHWREGVQALRLAGLLLPPLPATPLEPSPLPEPAPLVSVIVLTHNGRHHLEECLPSIQAQTYSNLEIVVVDDRSTDGTIAYLESHFPQVKIARLSDGPNFSAGCNLGAAHAAGEYYFFLNNDTRLDPHCVQELVAACQRTPDAAAAGAMMRLYYNPAFVNGLGARLRRFDFGYDIGLGNLDAGQFASVSELPAVCFGAALVSRAAWAAAGPLDRRYQFYYEDADWSFRARLMGFRLAAAPRALVFHKFSASMKEQPSLFKIGLATRNRLWFTLRNLAAGEALAQLALYGLHDLSRIWAAFWRGRWREVGTIYRAWFQFYIGLPGVLTARRQMTRRQRVGLTDLPAPLPPLVAPSETPYLHEGMLVNEYRPYLETAAPDDGRRRLLIISPDAVHSRMGGVGIRYWEMARQLAAVADVTLATPQETDLTADAFQIRGYEEGAADSLRPLVEAADIILFAGFTLYHHPELRRLPANKIIDMYDPMILENLERFADRPLAERAGLHQVGVNTFKDLFQVGDFFICATEKQWDYWLGGLTAANRVNPASYTADPTLRRLIDVVPFGLPDEPPQATRPALKGVWPGIGPDDKVILWGGGLWDWLDPLTLIGAMPAVLDEIPAARLFFLGTRHPNPAVPPSAMAERTIALAEQLGLRDTAVFFNDWTSYEERVDYLLEADVGVSLHGDHVETRFAARTRLMDYLWARLPMVINGGDTLGDMAEAHGLARVVATRDKAAVAAALVELLREPIPPALFAPVVERFYWSRVVRPLKLYVKRPWRNEGGMEAAAPAPTVTPIWRLPGKAFAALRARGWRGLRQDTASYLRWIKQQ
jgi:GT2 family glycosyltransferase/glycosyltransferase involved in cell wall biosynthesis